MSEPAQDGIMIPVTITRTLKKFDGEAPKEGEHKEPVEIITDEQTVLMTPAQIKELKNGIN